MYLESSSRLNFHLCDRLEGQAHGSQGRHEGDGLRTVCGAPKVVGPNPTAVFIFLLTLGLGRDQDPGHGSPEVRPGSLVKQDTQTHNTYYLLGAPLVY